MPFNKLNKKMATIVLSGFAVIDTMVAVVHNSSKPHCY